MSLIFLVAALVLAILAAINPPIPWPRPQLGWAAMACYFLSILLARGLN